jgi:Ca2+-binding RTX toxin-like protein
LIGNALSNTFRGGLGSDIIDGSGGFDVIVETRDADFTLTNSTLEIRDASGTEIDDLQNVESAILTAGAGNNRLDAGAFTLGGVELYGMEGDDILIGGYKGDTLFGGSGNDVLYGGAGSDSLLGEDGDDTLNGCGRFDPLRGADGDDDLVGGNGNDTYVFDLSSTTGSLSASIDLGEDTITEFEELDPYVGVGSADTILGLGRPGLRLNLNVTGDQYFRDRNGDVILTLRIANADTIEFAH